MFRVSIVVLVVCVSVAAGLHFVRPTQAAQNGIWFLNNSGSHVKLYLDDRLGCEIPVDKSCTLLFDDGSHVVRAVRADGGSQTLNVNQHTTEHVRIRAGYFEDAFTNTRLY